MDSDDTENEESENEQLEENTQQDEEVKVNKKDQADNDHIKEEIPLSNLPLQKNKRRRNCYFCYQQTHTKIMLMIMMILMLTKTKN